VTSRLRSVAVCETLPCAIISILGRVSVTRYPNSVRRSVGGRAHSSGRVTQFPQVARVSGVVARSPTGATRLAEALLDRVSSGAQHRRSRLVASPFTVTPSSSDLSDTRDGRFAFTAHPAGTVAATVVNPRFRP
jgi:hypothetical protein